MNGPRFDPKAAAMYGGPPRRGLGRADPEVATRLADMEDAIKPERSFERVGLALTSILTILGPLTADERRRVLAAVAAAVPS